MIKQAAFAGVLGVKLGRRRAYQQAQRRGYDQNGLQSAATMIGTVGCFADSRERTSSGCQTEDCLLSEAQRGESGEWWFRAGVSDQL